MKFLRVIFFGLVQAIELPINAILELWRQPGRGRGLVLGMPAILVLLLSLLTIGWAKYGSTEELAAAYRDAQKVNRAEIVEVEKRIAGLAPDKSQLGESEELEVQEGSTPIPAPPTLSAKEQMASKVTQAIQREIILPSDSSRPDNPKVVIRVSLSPEAKILGAEILTASSWPEWDQRVLQAVKDSNLHEKMREQSFIPPELDMEFGLEETRLEKLRYKVIIGLKKLIDLEPSNQKHKYDFAVLSAEMGDLEQARMMMDQVASPEKPGLAKAHVWQARYIWDDKTRREPLASKRLRCKNHLQLALKADPNDLEAHEGLGELYFSMGNFVDAERHYRVVWEQQLSTTLRLVSIYRARNDRVRLDEIVTKSKARLEEQLQADPNNYILVFDIERLCLLQGRIQEAIDTLLAHVTEENKDIFYPRLARIYSGWAKNIAGANGGVFNQEAFDKAKLALQYVPDHKDALWIMTLVGAQGQSFAAEAVAIYDPVANRATAPPEVLREYASYLIQQKREPEAIEWLEEAHQKAPNDPVTANNLAYLLLTANPSDPERALTLINGAIEQAVIFAEPAMLSSLFDTKAAALVALGRHADAIPFLEEALRDRVGDKRLLAALRDCYTARGDTAMAENYQRRIDEANQTTNQ